MMSTCAKGSYNVSGTLDPISGVALFSALFKDSCFLFIFMKGDSLSAWFLSTESWFMSHFTTLVVLTGINTAIDGLARMSSV